LLIDQKKDDTDFSEYEKVIESKTAYKHIADKYYKASRQDWAPLALNDKYRNIFSQEIVLNCAILELKMRDPDDTYYDNINKILWPNGEFTVYTFNKLPCRLNSKTLQRYDKKSIFFVRSWSSRSAGAYWNQYWKLVPINLKEQRIKNYVKLGLKMDTYDIFMREYKCNTVVSFHVCKFLLESDLIILKESIKKPTIYHLLEKGTLNKMRMILTSMKKKINWKVAMTWKGMTFNNVLEYIEYQITHGSANKKIKYYDYKLVLLDHILRKKCNTIIQEYMDKGEYMNSILKIDSKHNKDVGW